MAAYHPLIFQQPSDASHHEAESRVFVLPDTHAMKGSISKRAIYQERWRYVYWHADKSKTKQNTTKISLRLKAFTLSSSRRRQTAQIAQSIKQCTDLSTCFWAAVSGSEQGIWQTMEAVGTDCRQASDHTAEPAIPQYPEPSEDVLSLGKWFLRIYSCCTESGTCSVVIW